MSCHENTELAGSETYQAKAAPVREFGNNLSKMFGKESKLEIFPHCVVNRATCSSVDCPSSLENNAKSGILTPLGKGSWSTYSG